MELNNNNQGIQPPQNEYTPAQDAHTDTPLQNTEQLQYAGMQPNAVLPEQNGAQQYASVSQNTTPYAQSTAQPTTVRTAPPKSGSEFFIGINLLSKIGVVFIIIGVIAFSAVSAPYLEPLPRTLIIFALGLLMTGLGEIFYRLDSKIFARALTLGGIAELFISILIGAFAYEALNEPASIIIGTVIAAGGLALSCRYDSQTIMSVVTAAAFLPAFTAMGDINVIYCAVYLLAVQLASLLICHRKSWMIVPYIALAFNFVTSIVMFTIDDEMWYQYVCAIYMIISFALYVAVPLMSSLLRDGKLPLNDLIQLCCGAAAKLFLSLIFFWAIESVSVSGYVMLFFAVAYLALALLAKANHGSCTVYTTLIHITLSTACVAIFTAFIGRYAYMIFHVFAAALLLIGFIKNTKMYRIWGMATLIFAECYFGTYCLLNSDMDIFILQFALNAAIWIAIMAVYAVKGVRSTMFSVYSIATCANTAFLGIYLCSRLVETLVDNTVISSRCDTFYNMMLTAVIWMLVAFATGKLKFIGRPAAWASLTMYCLGLLSLLIANIGSIGIEHEPIQVIFAILINIASVLAALDMALTIQSFAPRFARAVGLVVSAYALFTLTIALGSNDLVAFTSCIISIIYMATASAWIVIGFIKDNPLLRRFGLVLVLFSSAKLFIFDFANVGPVERTLMFIGFGIVLLCISFIYVYFEKKMMDKNNK